MNYIEKATKWKNFKGLDSKLREQLMQMSDAELKEAFTEDLEFGTGGMRGILGPGTNRMNYYVVRKATLGFANYLIKKFPNERSIAISYDNRHYSKEFAFDCADLLSSLDFNVYVFEDLRATPELSFAVRYYKCKAGIMITASHNPKEYNGYKIYDEDGCQLIPSLASQVIDEINAIEDIFSVSIKPKKKLIHKIGLEVDKAYMEKVNTIRINKDLPINFSVVFTPLHGTGGVLGPQILENNGFKVYPVEAQMVHDPDFGAVKSSNPENKEAFDEAIQLGLEKKAKLVLANDPDADRLGMGCYHNGSYILLNGNQSATIMTHYICSELKRQGKLPNNGYLFTTNVSSDLPVKIATSFGLKYYITLTGFKFIGEQAKRIEGGIGTYIYGFEESYGCLIKDFVRDKDAMQAILMICEIEAFLEQKGMDLIDYLEKIYQEYGYSLETQSNIYLQGLDGKEKIKKIMNHFRENEVFLKYGNIVRKEDNLNQIAYDYLEKNIATSKIELPKSNVMKYFFEDGSFFVLRPSGTEPKLKVYYSTKGQTMNEAEKNNQALMNEVMKLVNAI